MGFFPMSGEATSDKWGILPILSSYPSFNNIPEVKIKKQKFHYIIRKFVNCEEKVIPYSVELSETIGKRKH